MAIVRELLIKLGFVTDKKAINATNQAIIGFKTRFAIAATAVGYAFNKVTSFFSDVAKATLDAEGLARTLGISFKEFNALTQAARQFRFSPEQFQSALRTANNLIRDWRNGFGDLSKIARSLKIEFDPNGDARSTLQAILNGISKIDDEQQRIYIAEQIFGSGLGVVISDLSQNIDKFNESAKEFQNIAAVSDQDLNALRDYEQAIGALSDAWTNFTRTVSKYVLPTITFIFHLLTTISNLYTNLFKGDVGGIKESLQAGSKLFDPIFEKLGKGFGLFNNFIPDFLKNTGSEAIKKASDFTALANLPFNPFGPATFAPAGTPQVTNNIEISVPPGSSAEQLNYMADQIQRAVSTSIFDTFREIENNNPRIE